MVKVIELIPTLGYGGAEALIKDYALLCDREKVEIIVVTWSGELGTANETLIKDAGIRIIHLEELRFPKGKQLNIFQKIYRKIGRFVDFRGFVLKEKPDVIHMHLRIGAYMRVLPLKKLGIKLIYTVHNPLERYFDKTPLKKKWWEYKECGRLIHRYNMLMITLHEAMRQSTMEYFETDNVITLNNGINLKRFEGKQGCRDTVRTELGLGIDEYVIGHIGSVTPQKNHDYVLDIYKDYLNRDSKARLLLIGKGAEKERILKKIEDYDLKDRIVFLEGRSDIPELMSAMDVFILPSLFEGYPVVAIEAQAMGLPCILSDRITKECLVTDKVEMLSIDGTTDVWCEAIDRSRAGDRSCCLGKTGKLEEYDILNSIRKLEGIFCNE